MGNFAPIMTAGLIFFNVIMFIIITAFAMDDVAIGQATAAQSALNESGDGVPGDISQTSMLTRFRLVLWNLPWWISALVIMLNVMLVPTTIFAWVRGL